MSDRKASNRYYPPEFWDQKNFNDKQNLNSFRGEGWRNRGAQVNSKLLTQGRDVIRFETPFDIVCLGCQEVIHKGVRFNADKRKAGKYFTTTIWEFELKCAKCDNKMFVRTDPENTTYKCEKGCRAAVQGWEEDEDTLKQPDAKEKRRIESDPFYKLEYSAADDGSGRRKDEVKAKEMKPVIANLRELVDVRSRDDALLNRALRRGFRGEKKVLKKRERDDAAERERLNYGIPILPASSEDAALAKRQQFGTAVGGVEEDARYEEARRSKRKEIMRASLFGESGASSSIGSSSSSSSNVGSIGSSSSSRILAPGSRAAKKVVLGVLGLGASGKKVGAGLTISTQPASVNASEQHSQGFGGESVLDSLGSMYGDDSDD